MNGITEERLLGILEYVKDNEALPELSTHEDEQLVGRNKLVWDYEVWSRGYWLTDKGVDWMTSLRNANIQPENVEN